MGGKANEVRKAVVAAFWFGAHKFERQSAAETGYYDGLRPACAHDINVDDRQQGVNAPARNHGPHKRWYA